MLSAWRQGAGAHSATADSVSVVVADETQSPSFFDYATAYRCLADLRTPMRDNNVAVIVVHGCGGSV